MSTNIKVSKLYLINLTGFYPRAQLLQVRSRGWMRIENNSIIQSKVCKTFVLQVLSVGRIKLQHLKALCLIINLVSNLSQSLLFSLTKTSGAYFVWFQSNVLFNDVSILTFCRFSWIGPHVNGMKTIFFLEKNFFWIIR